MMTILGLIAIALPFVVSPGASFSLTIGAIARGDGWGPVKVWVGTSMGIVLVASLAGATGLGSFVASNDTARLIFGVVGGALLMAFGVGAVLNAIRPSSDQTMGTNGLRRSLVLWSFLVVISNVKALSLYAVVVPGASDTGLTGGALYAAFAATHISMLLLWLSLLGLAMRRLPTLAGSPRARLVLVAAAGAMMLLLGIRSIVEALTSM